MSLQSTYKQFLADGKHHSLSPNISFNYITTALSFEGLDAVTKHLAKQASNAKKISDKILSVIEAPGALVLDIETTLKFISGGGAYLPSLDDNFLSDRVVTFPLVR